MVDISIKIDAEKCTFCRNCIKTCPKRVYTESNGEVVASNADRCMECFHCIAVCPEDAIEFQPMNWDEYPLVSSSDLFSSEIIFDLIRRRRSVRNYNSQPVKKEILLELIDVARYGATAKNNQDVEYIIADTSDKVKKIAEKAIEIIRMNKEELGFFSHLVRNWDKGRDVLFYDAPALILTHGPQSAPFLVDNSCYAVDNIRLLTQAHGLGSCIIGYFVVLAQVTENQLADYLEIPEDNFISGALVIGYPEFESRRLVKRQESVVKWL